MLAWLKRRPEAKGYLADIEQLEQAAEAMEQYRSCWGTKGAAKTPTFRALDSFDPCGGDSTKLECFFSPEQRAERQTARGHYLAARSAFDAAAARLAVVADRHFLGVGAQFFLDGRMSLEGLRSQLELLRDRVKTSDRFLHLRGKIFAIGRRYLREPRKPLGWTVLLILLAAILSAINDHIRYALSWWASLLL